MRLLGRRLIAPHLERRERTNHDVVSVPVPQRELLCSSIRVHLRLLFKPGDERACPLQCHIEIVDAEEQEQPVARCRVVRARQRRMLVRTPLVEAEQDSSIRIEDLTKVGMARLCLGLAEERLVPFEATRHIAYADDRPGAFHDISRVRRTGWASAAGTAQYAVSVRCRPVLGDIQSTDASLANFSSSLLNASWFDALRVKVNSIGLRASGGVA